MEQWKCSVCGYVHEGPLPADFICPVCSHGGSFFNKVEAAAAPAAGKYAGTKTEQNLREAYRRVGEIEKAHEERYRKLLNNVEMQQVFAKSGQTMWECRVCGHLVVGTQAPETCPVCKHSQSFFEVRKENY